MQFSPLNFKSTFNLRGFWNKSIGLVWAEELRYFFGEGKTKPWAVRENNSVEQLFIYIKANGCSQTLSNWNKTMQSFNSILTFNFFLIAFKPCFWLQRGSEGWKGYKRHFLAGHKKGNFQAWHSHPSLRLFSQCSAQPNLHQVINYLHLLQSIHMERQLIFS